MTEKGSMFVVDVVELCSYIILNVSNTFCTLTHLWTFLPESLRRFSSAKEAFWTIKKILWSHTASQCHHTTSWFFDWETSGGKKNTYCKFNLLHVIPDNSSFTIKACHMYADHQGPRPGLPPEDRLPLLHLNEGSVLWLVCPGGKVSHCVCAKVSTNISIHLCLCTLHMVEVEKLSN